MANEEMIAIHEYCISHEVEISFVDDLGEAGLLEITRIDDSEFITYDQLPNLEKLLRWHYDLDINLEGIETIHHLLQQMESMQQQLREIRTRLSLYESVEEAQRH